MDQTIINDDLKNIILANLPWNLFSGKSILITGIGGLIGGYIYRALLRLEHTSNYNIKIEGIARNPASISAELHSAAERVRSRIIKHDLNEAYIGDQTYDFVIHCASPCTPSEYRDRPSSVLLPNTVGTSSLLKNTKKEGSFLFLSSAEVCGTPDTELISEDRYFGFDHLAPRACYAEAKRAGEALCVAWSTENGSRSIIARLFHTYGPTAKLGDGRVYSDFLSDVLRQHPPTIRSDGSAIRSYCYIVDAVIGIFTALFFGKSGSPYNIGNPEGQLSVKELANLLCQIGNIASAPLFEKPKSNYLASALQESIPDIRRISALGWRAETSPLDGFRRTLQSYQEIQTEINQKQNLFGA